MNNRGVMALAVAIGLVVMVGVVVFAGPPASSEELERAVAEGASSAPDAFAEAGISASRACVFGPYSTDEAIAHELGFAWDGAAATTGIGTSDGHELLVAADDARVIAWALVLRPTGSDLVEGDYGCRRIG